jgi:DNA-binding ferritin-like protein
LLGEFEIQRSQYPLTIADGSAHVEAVAKALSTFGREARVSIEEATTLDDADTADLFTEVSRGIDKWLWFVEATHRRPNKGSQIWQDSLCKSTMGAALA